MVEPANQTTVSQSITEKVNAYWDKRIADAAERYTKIYDTFHQNPSKYSAEAKEKAAATLGDIWPQVRQFEADVIKHYDDVLPGMRRKEISHERFAALPEVMVKEFGPIEQTLGNAMNVYTFSDQALPFLVDEKGQYLSKGQGLAKYKDYLEQSKQTALDELNAKPITTNTVFVLGAEWCAYSSRLETNVDYLSQQYDPPLDVRRLNIQRDDNFMTRIAGQYELASALMNGGSTPQMALVDEKGNIIIDSISQSAEKPVPGKLPTGNMPIPDLVSVMNTYFGVKPKPGSDIYRQKQQLTALNEGLVKALHTINDRDRTTDQPLIGELTGANDVFITQAGLKEVAMAIRLPWERAVGHDQLVSHEESKMLQATFRDALNKAKENGHFQPLNGGTDRASSDQALVDAVIGELPTQLVAITEKYENLGAALGGK